MQHLQDLKNKLCSGSLDLHHHHQFENRPCCEGNAWADGDGGGTRTDNRSGGEGTIQSYVGN